MKIKVIDGQSLLDISTQKTGTIENIVALGLANDIGITDDLSANDEIDVADDLPIVKDVTDYYIQKDITPGTKKNIELPLPMGIGNEYIENPEPVFTVR